MKGARFDAPYENMRFMDENEDETSCPESGATKNNLIFI